MKIEDIPIEPHPFGSFVPPESEILIIGTFPTHFLNRDFDFFYPNHNNVFWKIIGSIYDYSFKNRRGPEAVTERKDLMEKHKIALTDMMSSAKRIDESSSDDKLILDDLMDIISILINCQTIRRVVLTSRSGRINARQLFEMHLSKKDIKLFITETGKLIKGHFDFLGRQIEVYIPYSPSPRVVRRFTFEILKDMYVESLLHKTYQNSQS